MGRRTRRTRRTRSGGGMFDSWFKTDDIKKNELKEKIEYYNTRFKDIFRMVFQKAVEDKIESRKKKGKDEPNTIDIMYDGWLNVNGMEDSDEKREVFLDEYKKEWKELNKILDDAFKFYDKKKNDRQTMKDFYNLSFEIKEEGEAPYWVATKGIFSTKYRGLFSPDKTLYKKNGHYLYGSFGKI